MPDSQLDVPHFANGRFFNPGVPAHNFRSFLRWMRSRRQGHWRKTIPAVYAPPPPKTISDDSLVVTFINHSTVLLQSEGLNILTDPVWSDRVSPLSFAGPRRHRIPGIRLADLPRIDLILLSHNHYDHCDLATLRHLRRRDNPAIACPLGVATLLRSLGYSRILELDWAQSTTFAHLTLHCTRAQHFASRTPFDRNQTLWCGWIASFSAGHVYFAGDTGFGSFFPALAERFPHLRLALLPIGAYKPEWFMGPIHTSPDDALAIHHILRPQCSIAIHHGTFSLADDGEIDATEALARAIERNPPPTPFLILPEGATHTMPA